MPDEITEKVEAQDVQGLEETAEGNQNNNPAADPQDDAAKNAVKEDEENKGKEDGEENECYGSPEAFDYSEIPLPEGMQLDEELLQEFEPLARKFNLSNKSTNELMALGVKLVEKNMSKFGDYANQLVEAEKESYQQLLNTDKELNANNKEHYDQYLDVAVQGLKAVATPGFTDVLKNKGLTHHPEFIKTFHKIGQLCKNDSIPDATIPVGTDKDAADILYGNKEE